jgi:hypothetical protein
MRSQEDKKKVPGEASHNGLEFQRTQPPISTTIDNEELLQNQSAT